MLPKRAKDQDYVVRHCSQEVTEQKEKRFEDFGLSERLHEALRHVGYEMPSPIQADFLPVALTGADCMGQAHTGTGKTAAFVIPILERIDHETLSPQALVLAPTRELSEQVAGEVHRLSYTSPCRVVCVVGGRPIRPQIETLRKGVQVVVGTPGRVIDLLQRHALSLETLKIVVLDEADRMLDIGFRPDIERILRKCPTERQTMLLSATVPPPVERLAKRYMKDPVGVDLSGQQVASDSIEQHYITVDEERKFSLLVRLLGKERPRQAIVFTRTKVRADHLYRRFAGKLPKVAHLHGDLPQAKRDRVMQRFREGRVRLLIATDVMGRGIDVTGISHIINYDIPEYCDDYIHRIGRTGRMTSDEMGHAITFVTREQGSQLTSIEMRVNKQLTEYVIDDYQAFQPGPPPKHVGKEDKGRGYYVA